MAQLAHRLRSLIRAYPELLSVLVAATVVLSATPFGSHTIQLSGTMPYQAPGGSTVMTRAPSSATSAATSSISR